MDGDGAFNITDIAEQLKANNNNEWAPLKGDGDFRSDECVELLKQSDIVVTNPPFSLFREYVSQLIEYDKKFLIIGNMNAITYKEIFPLVKDNKMWLGVTRHGTGSMWFQVGQNMPKKTGQRVDENGIRYQTIGNSAWFTNLDHGRRHQELSLMKAGDVIKFGTKKPFDKYDNYDAIEVSLVKHIPSDYKGVMGVPITFLGKYNPNQFEIIGMTKTPVGTHLRTKEYPRQTQVGKKGDESIVTKLNDGGAIEIEKPIVGKVSYKVNGKLFKATYPRVLIKHRKASS
jgi:hypothetical protein